MVYVVWWFLFKTKQGLILRAIGDNHDAAHAIGHKVVLYRFMAILFGGAMAGLGGAFLSLVQVPIWGEGMTAGRGWIALGLVVFASWLPFRIILGAILFGGITILQLHAQGFNFRISAQYLSMLPYLATIVILVALRIRLKNKTNRTMPNCLGRIFHSTT
jgi:simple sugar transport system permease protein